MQITILQNHEPETVTDIEHVMLIEVAERAIIASGKRYARAYYLQQLAELDKDDHGR